MPDDTDNKKKKSTPKPEEPKDAAPEETSDEELEEVEYSSYADVVIDFLNEVAGLAAPYLDAEQIGMITVVAVSADGNYSQSHEVSKLPESAGNDEAEKARLERLRAGSRLHTISEMQKHKTRLVDELKDHLNKLDG